MSSLCPSSQEFANLLASLLANLTPDMIRTLFSIQTPYYNDIQMTEIDSMRFLDMFKRILDTVLQLEVCFEHNGITRDDARNFIALFDGMLTPTFEAATVRSDTVGQEIHRILNHMAYSMKKW
jgi:hypothetical protein